MKRHTKPQHIPHRITAGAVDAFRQGDALRLHSALKLKHWQVSPLDVDVAKGEGEPTSWGQSFVLARELKLALSRCDQGSEQADHG